jgi:dienelactone hydrolase
MADQQATITVAGLQPHQRVTLQADLTDGGSQPWASKADFTADDSGSIDTSKQAPEKGSSYSIVSAMGLVWSMKPTGDDTHTYRMPRNTEDIHFALMVEGRPVAEAHLQQIFLPTDRHEVRLSGALHGILYLPTTPGPHPGVLVVGGSEGGLPSPKAIWLVSHGYAALALAYFRFEGLPDELQNIPLEYFGQAIQWMQQRPEIDAKRIAIVGTSRGGELALQLGVMYPQIRAVVAYVPANDRIQACCGSHLYASWTWQGMPLPYTHQTTRYGIPNDPAAVIPVEHTHGPILLVSGQDDDVWPSEGMTSVIVRRLEIARFPYEVVRLNYSHAGHRAGNPFIVPTWSHGVRTPVTGQEESFGGTPEGNALSSIDAIPKVLDFLARSLAPPPATKP